MYVHAVWVGRFSAQNSTYKLLIKKYIKIGKKREALDLSPSVHPSICTLYKAGATGRAQ